MNKNLNEKILEMSIYFIVIFVIQYYMYPIKLRIPK